jgi:hypothetical protein
LLTRHAAGAQAVGRPGGVLRMKQLWEIEGEAVVRLVLYGTAGAGDSQPLSASPWGGAYECEEEDGEKRIGEDV